MHAMSCMRLSCTCLAPAHSPPFFKRSGQLVYPNADAAYGLQASCTPAGCNYGCAPLSEASPPVALKREPGKRYIMLLDRGPRE